MKKLLLALLLTFASPALALGPPVVTLLQSYEQSISGSVTYSLSVGQTIPTGSVIVVYGYEFQNHAFGGSVSDTAGDTYSTPSSTYCMNPDANQASYGFSCIFWGVASRNLIGAGGDSITYTPAVGGNMVASIFYITNLDTGGGHNPFDSGSNVTTNGLSASPSCTSNAAARGNELMFGYVALARAAFAGLTEPSGWTALSGNLFFSDSNTLDGYLTNTGTSGVTFNPGVATSNAWACRVFGFEVPNNAFFFTPAVIP